MPLQLRIAPQHILAIHLHLHYAKLLDVFEQHVESRKTEIMSIHEPLNESCMRIRVALV